MRRRPNRDRNLSKKQGRQAETPKRRDASKSVRLRSSDTTSETELARYIRERDEAQDQQAAAAEVLKVISRSTFDLQTVLDTLTKSAVQLCAADRGIIAMQDGDRYRVRAVYGHSREAEQYALGYLLTPPDRGRVTSRVALEGKAVHIPDVLADPKYTTIDNYTPFRTALGVPLLREGTTIGVFTLVRIKVNPFTDKQIELVSTFSDQAVIAIENTRLLNELRESLKQQTATADILRVVSSSSGDLEPVFGAMLENAIRICDANFGNIYRYDGERLHLVAWHNTPAALVEDRKRSPYRPSSTTPTGRALASKATVHVLDAAVEPAYTEERNPGMVAVVELGGMRTYVVVPLLKETEVIGVLTVLRQEVRAFTDKQIELLQNFAAQAVIAIENARLLNELRQLLEHHRRAEAALADSERQLRKSHDELEMKVAERTADLRCSEAKFRDYAETASDWFWEIGPDYKFTLLTENAFGSDPADRIGTACWDHALDLEAEPEKWRLIRAALDSRKPFRDFVYCATGGNDSPMYVKASGKPVFDVNGEFRGYRGTGTDVTAIMRAQRVEASLRTVQAELAHVGRVTTLGQLTASIAHEVTQPIASARNNARAALNFLDRQAPDLGEVKEALECVVADADRAGDIIDRIRDHIKKAPPRKDRVDLNEAINEVIVLARSAITKNGVSVQTRLTEGPLLVQGDRVQVQQVVLNLILNAVEAMGSVEAGPRELLIRSEQRQPNGVLVTVRDTGPGIDPEHLERVFEAFYTTKSNGVGMGLSICRSIIEAHGGRLWADANEARGAVFQFTLPDAENS
jgi:C4-dicarboxylate-specific signal transduction histidine kinase